MKDQVPWMMTVNLNHQVQPEWFLFNLNDQKVPVHKDAHMDEVSLSSPSWQFPLLYRSSGGKSLMLQNSTFLQVELDTLSYVLHLCLN